MINTLFLMTVAVLLLLSFSTGKHMSLASSAILSNFFEEQCTQNHPQYLSGLSHGLSPKLFLKKAVYITAILMTTGTFFIICTDQQYIKLFYKITTCILMIFFFLNQERHIEDHENVMAILNTWAPHSNNKLLFRKDSYKYHFFAHTSVSLCFLFLEVILAL